MEQRANRAHLFQEEIIRGALTVRYAWIHMAQKLYAIRAEKLYELLGAESFHEWIATPEVQLQRSQAYALTGIYKELVVERDIPVERLQTLDPSQIAEVIPAIRKGADVEECLSDAQVLSRSDLRAKYRGTEPRRKHSDTMLCPNCGTEVKVK